MITYSEADYIVREIGNISRYRAWIRNYDEELRELRSQIDNLTAPVSPNGKESIGEAKGNGRTFICCTFEEFLNALKEVEP